MRGLDPQAETGLVREEVVDQVLCDGELLRENDGVNESVHGIGVVLPVHLESARPRLSFQDLRGLGRDGHQQPRGHVLVDQAAGLAVDDADGELARPRVGRLGHVLVVCRWLAQACTGEDVDDCLGCLGRYGGVGLINCRLKTFHHLYLWCIGPVDHCLGRDRGDGM